MLENILFAVTPLPHVAALLLTEFERSGKLASLSRWMEVFMFAFIIVRLDEVTVWYHIKPAILPIFVVIRVILPAFLSAASTLLRLIFNIELVIIIVDNPILSFNAIAVLVFS